MFRKLQPFTTIELAILLELTSERLEVLQGNYTKEPSKPIREFLSTEIERIETVILKLKGE